MGASEIRAGQLRINYIVDGSQTASLGMFELTVPPGRTSLRRSHSNNERCVYVLTERFAIRSGRDGPEAGRR
jgi:hypothetical protein